MVHLFSFSMLRFLLDCRSTVKLVFSVSPKGLLTGYHKIVFLRDTIQGRSITKRRKLMTPDYCSKNPCNCWWDCYLNGAVLELSSISPREISEFQKITSFEQNPEKKSRWKCSGSVSPIFQNLQFEEDVSIVSEWEYQREGLRICVQSNLQVS